tara:strand:+ start:1240 stop:1905 length:666 start_codon:yes stop_codon:yes gene_type:complete
MPEHFIKECFFGVVHAASLKIVSVNASGHAAPRQAVATSTTGTARANYSVSADICPSQALDDIANAPYVFSMFDTLKTFLNTFTGDDEQHFSQTDPRLAAAALLVHTISIDGVVADEEKTLLRTVLQSKYALSAEETDELIAEAGTADKEAVDLYGFTSILKRSLDEEERLDIVAMIWDIVYADGVVHEFEDNLVWRIAELMGISSRDRMILKKRAGKLAR